MPEEKMSSKSAFTPNAPAFDINDKKKWPDFSVTVNTLLSEVEAYQGGADIIDVVRILRKLHHEYGENNRNAKSTDANIVVELVQFLEKKRTLLKLSKYKDSEWANEIKTIVTKPQSPPVINGRLFLIATLLWQFSEIYNQLQKDQQWQSLCLSVIQQLDSELSTLEKTTYKTVLTEKGYHLLKDMENPTEPTSQRTNVGDIMFTNNLSDVPTKDDSLSRRALATYLVNRLRHIYNRDIHKGGYGSFFMHIDGEWGSGKSTLLGFMEEELETKAPLNPKIDPNQKSQQEWIVVTFNAWENQRLDPPWWFLMKTIYRESMHKMWKTNKGRWMKTGFNEFLWRFNAGNNYLKLTALITLVIFGWALISNAFSVKLFQGLPVVETVTLLGFIWSIAKLVSSSLLPGSAKAAHSFIEENGKDPMNELATHFEKMIREIDTPIAIFIDDLDRCNRDYGIRLLEGLQTIFKRAPVVYVIAADRKWLKTMYEDQYSIFAPAISRPAKSFGLVFLDKIFQLIVELPDISAIQKKIYWNKLLNINDPSQPVLTNAEKTDIENKVLSAVHNDEKLNVVNQTATSQEGKQYAKEVAVSTVSILEEEKILEHKLQKFIELIEANPRSMKRLINDVSTAKTITYLYDQNIDTDQLILWTILKQEHPSLAEYFWDNPSKINEVFSYTGKSGPLTNIKAYDDLLSRDNVKSLFNFQPNGEELKLDKAFLDIMQFKIKVTPEA
jgi:hypothetical protein